MPKNENRDTREVILTVALKLFSERGYDGVGVRDIAKEIGIRESALYKHYSGKKDIFNSIIKDIERRYQEEVVCNSSSSKLTNIHLGNSCLGEELYSFCVTMFQFYLKNEYGSQLRRMLTIEQYRTSEVSDFFQELVIENGLDYISDIFYKLIKDNVYVDADSRVMALQFYSPLYLLISKYDNQPEKYDEAFSFLERHITQFHELYLQREKP